MLFPLGRKVMTATVAAWADERPLRHLLIAQLLMRHARGDWGDLCEEDFAENEASLTRGLRLLSAYTIDDTKLWIITEADRSATTVLFPSDY
jgi:hypothetical protein